MADFFKGLAGGFQTGLQFGEAVRRRNEYEEQLAERERLRQIYGAEPTMTPGQAATPEQIQSAGLETGRLQMNDITGFQLSTEEAARYAPQMPSAQATTTPTTYSFGGSTRQTPFSADELNRMRMQQAIPVLAVRNPAEAMRMQSALSQEARQQAADERQAAMFPLQQQALRTQIAGQGLQQELTGVQLASARRTQEQAQAFDTGLVEHFKTKFDSPEAEATALLRLVERTQGPQAAASLRSTMTANQLSELTLGAQRLTAGFNSAFQRGPDAVMKWVDEQNPDFTLKREGNNLLVTYADGRTEKREFKNTNELMSYFAAQGSPSNFLTYQNNLMQRENEANLNKIREIAYGAKTLTQKIDEAKKALGRDLTDDEKKVLAGVAPRIQQRDLSPADMENLRAANRVIEERIKLSGGRISNADRVAIYKAFNLNPELLNVPGLPDVGQGGGETKPTPGLARGALNSDDPPVIYSEGSGLSSIMSRPQASTRDVIEADLVRRAAERGLARDRLRDIYRSEVEQLGLTVDAVKELAPQRARDLRNSPYFELFPRNVQRALTDRAGM